MTGTRTAVTALLAALALSAQFEVASIKPTAPGADSSTSDLLPGRFRATNRTAVWMMRIAYHVQDAEILNAPDWVRSQGFDVDARTGHPEEIKPEQMEPLLRSLLEDRFRLKVHRETRQGSTYSLLPDKNGPKMKRSEATNPEMNSSMVNGKMVLESRGLSLAGLAGFIARQVGRPVEDHSGLTGTYDIHLEWSPDDNPNSPAPSIFSAVQEQLGLRMEARKTAIDVIVVDSIERPSNQ